MPLQMLSVWFDDLIEFRPLFLRRWEQSLSINFQVWGSSILTVQCVEEDCILGTFNTCIHTHFQREREKERERERERDIFFHSALPPLLPQIYNIDKQTEVATCNCIPRDTLGTSCNVKFSPDGNQVVTLCDQYIQVSHEYKLCTHTHTHIHMHTDSSASTKTHSKTHLCHNWSQITPLNTWVWHTRSFFPNPLPPFPISGGP